MNDKQNETPQELIERAGQMVEDARAAYIAARELLDECIDHLIKCKAAAKLFGHDTDKPKTDESNDC